MKSRRIAFLLVHWDASFRVGSWGMCLGSEVQEPLWCSEKEIEIEGFLDTWRVDNELII